MAWSNTHQAWVTLASLLSPNKAEGIIYGLGVTMIAPTAKDSFPV